MEATGHAGRFERLLAELGFELWIGDPAEIKTKRVRKQKTDREEPTHADAAAGKSLSEDLGTQSRKSRSATTALAPTSAGADEDADHEPAAGRGHERRLSLEEKAVQRKGTSTARKLSLAPWASPRRKELLELLDQLDQLDPKIAELTAAVEQEAKKRPEVLLLRSHPGVGPITGLAYVLIIGMPDRFPRGKQVGSYTGLNPCEDSSAGRQRLGHISKQGNSLLRFLLVEASQAAARCNPDWRRRYAHLMMRREKRIAKVAMARKLAVRLYWMWRNHWQYSQLVEFGSNAGKLGTVHGVK